MENNVFDRVAAAPSAAMKDISVRDDFAHDGPQVISEADAMKGSNQTLVDPLGAPQDAPQGPGSPGSDRPTLNPTASGNAPSGKLGDLLNAKTTIGIVDSILPAVAVIALQYFFKLKINKRELQLNEQEREIIKVPLQNYLDSVAINFDSPLNALLITVAAVYGSKFAEKGFTAYFDKRDEDNARAERAEKLKRETAPVVTEKPENIDLSSANQSFKQQNNKTIDPRGTETKSLAGLTWYVWQIEEAKADAKKRGISSPGFTSLNAYLKKKYQPL